MALLTVHSFPDPVLKQKALPVKEFDEKLAELADNMLETMYEERGIGLAAVQVGVLKQLVVVDLKSGEEDISLREPRVFVNPHIVERSGETISEEGCLSVIEYRAEIKRAESIKLEFQDLQGEPRTMEAEGLLSICIQHELDHLQGILFIDHLPMLKQKMVKKRLAKLAREAA
ncbi:MAG: peptide deformylase [SAR324 cluster bacterium]|jgi:peptide deformylase|nr:peptide deformylase [Deltaproteobacteria bacterium]MDP6090389.1 peptide deformylase [SAR324 cluster bacterium]MBP44424.1 peptide deformylase [Deltaproteobacteria bacterium]MDP6249011.1 peptide deformylase [SAR324 cluster bacterium]MDP6330841.1 peptide deformylase [SAR324 cluster bacterium]|tara:strand:+ start:133 stop:651 length:519 start_codon:yes stop_codon:yes gene_type:complete